MKIGVFLARFQPFHNSHKWLIDKSLIENEQTYVFIGSADKSREERNPLTIEERMDFLKNVYEKALSEQKIILIPFNDYSNEDDIENVLNWGEYLYKSICDTIGQKQFSLYYSDDPSIMLGWFKDDVKQNINFRFFDRKEIFSTLSATKIRNALITDDDTYLKENLPEKVYEKKEVLADIVKSVEENKKGEQKNDKF